MLNQTEIYFTWLLVLVNVDIIRPRLYLWMAANTNGDMSVWAAVVPISVSIPKLSSPGQLDCRRTWSEQRLVDNLQTSKYIRDISWANYISKSQPKHWFSWTFYLTHPFACVKRAPPIPIRMHQNIRHQNTQMAYLNISSIKYPCILRIRLKLPVGLHSF